MSIVTLADAKAHLNIDADDPVDDVELQGFIDAATAAVEKELGRVVVPRTVTDVLHLGAGAGCFLLRSVPVISLTSIAALDGSQTWSVGPSVMHIEAHSGAVTVLSGPWVSGSVLAVYQAGQIPVAANVRLAAKIIIEHLWETQRGVMRVQLGGDGEQPPYMSGRGYAIPRRAQELLDNQLPGVA